MDPNRVFKRGKALEKENKRAIVFFMCKTCSSAMTIHRDNINKERLGLIVCGNCRAIGSWKRI